MNNDMQKFGILMDIHNIQLSNYNNKGYIGVAYRSPSQDAIGFQNFLSNFVVITLSDYY